MSKEKLKNLTKYQFELKNKAESKVVPAKHANSPESYRAFLANELRLVATKLEALAQSGGK